MTVVPQALRPWRQVKEAARREAQRLMALCSLDILDSPAEPEFDRIARLAAAFFKAPIALVSLVDADRQWFKAAVGLATRETPRCFAFCDWAIRSPDIFIVLDARHDPRFASNPLVTGLPNVVFYAGAPLSLETGERIGTVCVIDHVPRPALHQEERTFLSDLAALTVTALTRRQLIERLTEVIRARPSGIEVR